MMAVVTRLRTQNESPRQHNENHPGEAPKLPDAWFARFRRIVSSRQKPIVSEPGYEHREAGDALVSGPSLRSDSPAAAAPHEVPAEPVAGPTTIIQSDAGHQPLRGSADLESSHEHSESRKTLSNPADRVDVVSTSGTTALASPPQASQEDRLAPTPVALPQTASSEAAVQSSALPAFPALPTLQEEADDAAAAAVHANDQVDPVSASRKGKPVDKSAIIDVDPHKPSTLTPLSKQSTLTHHPDGTSSAATTGQKIQNEGQLNFADPLEISKVVEDNKPGLLLGNEVQKELQAEKLLFEKTVGRWMHGIIRHSVKGLGPGVRIRIELEYSDERTAVRRLHTIIIFCHGLSSQKLREIDRIFARSSHAAGLQGFAWEIRPTLGFGFRGGFSNTGVWRHYREPLIDISLPQNSATLCGSPIKAEQRLADNEPESAAWTCGGLILVDGNLYGLTTAHPLIVQEQGKLTDEPSKNDDGFEPDPMLWQPWDTVGRVDRFALSQEGVVPDNCDWLLFDVGTRFQLPNQVRIADDSAEPWIEMHSSSLSATNGNLPCHIYTSHGVISAKFDDEASFLIIGDSAFITRKLHLKGSLKPGDSGAWALHKNQLLGVVVAADDSTLSAFIILIDDVLKSISVGLDHANVELPSSLDNRIMSCRLKSTRQDREQLTQLCIQKAFQLDGELVEFTKLVPQIESRASYTGLSAYITLGALVEAPSDRLQAFLHRHRHNKIVPYAKSNRMVARLAKLRYGQSFISFVGRLASYRLDDLSHADRLNYVTLFIEAMLEQLAIEPVTLPSTNEIRQLIDDIAFAWPISLRLYRLLRRQSPMFPMHVNIPDHIPSPELAARLVFRLVSFDRSRYFFLYHGPYARWLTSFAQPYDAIILSNAVYPIAAAGSRSSHPQKIPRVFLRLDDPEDGYATPEDGKFVRYDKLSDLLERHAKGEDERSAGLSRQAIGAKGPVKGKKVHVDDKAKGGQEVLYEKQPLKWENKG